MHFVTTTSVDVLSKTVNAERFGETYISSHSDGTIVLRDSNLDPQKVWLNMGKQITAFTIFDDTLFIACSDLVVRQFSLETGMLLREFELPFVCHRFSVFEYYVACVPMNSNQVSILHRLSVEIIEHLPTESEVVDVCDVNGKIVVVCKGKVYLLKTVEGNAFHFTLNPVYSPKFEIEASASAHNGTIVLLGSKDWKLIKFKKDYFEFQEDFNIPAPGDLVSAKAIGIGVLIQCVEGRYFFLRSNNIQVVESPFKNNDEIITNFGLISPSTPNVLFKYEVDHNELTFSKITVEVCVGTEKYLLNQSDPSITCSWESYIGNDKGEINGIQVFPGAILAIKDNLAYSAHGCVSLPLKPINMVLKNESNKIQFTDSRVSIPTKISTNPGEGKWTGVEWCGYVCLQPNDLSLPQIAVLHILSEQIEVDSALNKLTVSEGNLLILENLVISSCESKERTPKLYETAQKLLQKVWTAERFTQVAKYMGSRSLKLLAIMSNGDYIAVRDMIVQMIRRGTVSDCLAILWVFLNVPEAIVVYRIPFLAMQHIPEAATASFSKQIALKDGDKLLSDAISILKQTPHADKTEILYTIKVLQLAVTQTNFPHSESQLIKLVEAVIPSVTARVRGAKQILTRLITTNRILYHQPTQKLLIATPQAKNQAALILGVMDHTKLKLMSTGLPSDLQPVFSTDGKTVMAAVGRKGYAWHIVKTFSLFRTSNELEPVEMD